ncbi:hypothetical protein GTA51_15705 [Desulfovibrio aerotolerans]|uniref:DUF2147 domain-containing protein n=1 Tax=Solidesulfovibrio aerotolerans TaxID=295255 RepID=A0A7C9INW4_9BACT|nr:hypothetical protein [Solidesulfovibrio aerotolerans]MYL84566.1 hypothetical protein [Solidesulfovibrio aerotolerans]
MIHLTRLSVILLATLWLGLAVPAQAQQDAGIVGTWSAAVLGQEVTANFTRQGDMIYGVVVLPDISGKTNTYHLAGVIVGADFAAQHGSGHLLKGRLTGPNTAEAVFTLKSGPAVPLHLVRRTGP